MKAIQKLLDMPNREDTAIIASPAEKGLAIVAAGRADACGRSVDVRPVDVRPVDLRLVELTENAIAARSLARSYLSIARKFLETVRRSRAMAHPDLAEAHLQEARRAHEQARKCLGFARLCERRAGGAPFADHWR